MHKKNKVTILSSLGAGLEYYDFVIYGMMAPYLSALFFPSDAVVWGMIKTFSIFAVGYVARPLGGIVFGVIGDKFGRQKVFSSIMFLMALSTLSIGLLPTSETLGVFAAILLAFFRILQGVSLGAEIPGAITVVSEHQKPESTGIHTSFVISSATCGALFASLVLALLTYACTKEEILSGWWRIPFLLGGGLAIVSYIARSQITETPEFQKNIFQPQEGVFEPLKLLLVKYYPQVLLSIGLKLFPAALVITNIYYPTYFNTFFGYQPYMVFNAMNIGLVFAAVILPILGIIVDKKDRIKLSMMAVVLFLMTGIFCVEMLKTADFLSLSAFFVIHQFFLTLTMICTLPIMVKLFPTKVRFTGIALCYNISYLLASFLPVIYSGYLEQDKTPFVVFYVLISVSVLSLVSASILFIKKKHYFVE